jgi:hypothetical protein
MIRKIILNEAKAFLCWDQFPELSVQLIEMQEAVSFFYPPAQRPIILVYYERGKDDFSIPLFHLFHEAGHYLQMNHFQSAGKSSEFRDMIQKPAGQVRHQFEKEGWNLGRDLLSVFARKNKLPSSVLNEYDTYAKRAVKSYL